MSPIFPYITDFKKIILKIKEFIDEYWFENLNLRGEYKNTILKYIKEKYPNYYMEYEKIYIKNDKTYWQELATQITVFCKENNIKYQNYFYHEKIVKKSKENKNGKN